MNTKAIEEAVKALTPVNGITKDGTGFLTREALDTALKVMQQYLAVKGMPEEKKCEHEWITKWKGGDRELNVKYDPNYFECKKCGIHKVMPLILTENEWAYNEGFNSALHLCRLAVIKGVPSVEQMSRIIFEHYQNPNASAYLLATAIHKLYLERLGIKK